MQEAKRLSDRERFDWLRLSRCDNVGPRGIRQQASKAFFKSWHYLAFMPRAEILTHQAKHTLLQLHAELCGKVDANKKEAETLAESIAHVEAVLKLLDPDHNLRPQAVHRRKRNPWFKHGTQFRHVLEALGAVKKPLTTIEVTDAIIAARGIRDLSPDDVRVIQASVGKSLQHQSGVTITKHEGWPVRWSLKA